MTQMVYTLLCERDVSMALITLPKLLTFLHKQQHLTIIDDGSLTGEAISKLENLSGNIRISRRIEREQLILDALKNYPNCRKFRKEFPFALKLLDIPLLAAKDSTRFTYTDSDIIYLKNCEAYFDRDSNTFLRTDAIKLSVRLRKVFTKYRWRIPYKFNAGYFSFDTSNYDLDFIEFFTGLPDVRNCSWLIEQTCWALLFGRSGVSVCPSENQFVCQEIFDGPDAETLAIHLIGPLKGKLEKWAFESKYIPSETSMPIFLRSRNVTILDWAGKSAHRLFNSF